MSRSNQAMVPEAREALNKFKMEAASDFDVPPPSKPIQKAKKHHQTLHKH